MEADNDDAYHNDSFPFLSWTGEGLSKDSISQTNDSNGLLVLSPHPSLAPRRVTRDSIPKFEFDPISNYKQN